MKIDSAELIIYGEKSLTLSLSDHQLFVIFKALGIQINQDNYSCFSDDFLEKLISSDEFKNKNIINKDWVNSD